MINRQPTDVEQTRLKRIATARSLLPFLVVPIMLASPFLLNAFPQRIAAVATILLIVVLAPIIYLSFFVRCPRCAGWIAVPKCPGCGLALEMPVRSRDRFDFMYALVVVVVHAVVSSAATLAVAPHSMDPVATTLSLWNLCMTSAAMCGIGFFATSRYLSRRIRGISGALVGLLCGSLCSIIIGLVMWGIEYSLVLYLAILAPTLLSVLLASLLDRPRSGWQT